MGKIGKIGSMRAPKCYASRQRGVRSPSVRSARPCHGQTGDRTALASRVETRRDHAKLIDAKIIRNGGYGPAISARPTSGTVLYSARRQDGEVPRKYFEKVPCLAILCRLVRNTFSKLGHDVTRHPGVHTPRTHSFKCEHCRAR